MRRNSFNYRFYCRSSKIAKKTGLAPVELSVIVNGDRVFITLPRKMSPKDFERDMAKRTSNETKTFVSVYEGKVNNAVTEILQRNESLTAMRIKDYVTGNGSDRVMSLDGLIKSHLSVMKERTRAEIGLDTYKRYEVTYDALIRCVGNKQLDKITLSDMERFYTNVLSGHESSTAYGYMSRCRTLFRFAVNESLIRKSPMSGLKVRKSEKKIEIITVGEYERIRDMRFGIERLEKVRKLFVLGCNSGMAYADLMLLRKEDIQEKDGVTFVRKPRKKTGVEYTSVILNDGLCILGEIDKLKLSNQKLNSYLKSVADHCGITKNLTMHMSRHYYITRLIRDGYPIEIVRQCAGHSRTQMTERYMHLVSDDVLNAFRK